jgi:hypothetical protein
MKTRPRPLTFNPLWRSQFPGTPGTFALFSRRSRFPFSKKGTGRKGERRASVASMQYGDGTASRFRCPANAKKLVHRWRDRVRLPDVKEL